MPTGSFPWLGSEQTQLPEVTDSASELISCHETLPRLFLRSTVVNASAGVITARRVFLLLKEALNYGMLVPDEDDCEVIIRHTFAVQLATQNTPYLSHWRPRNCGDNGANWSYDRKDWDGEWKNGKQRESSEEHFPQSFPAKWTIKTVVQGTVKITSLHFITNHAVKTYGESGYIAPCIIRFLLQEHL